MKKLLAGASNLLYLIKPYWKHGKLYLLGRIAIPLLITPALALLEVRVIQDAVNAISQGKPAADIIVGVAALFGAILGLTVVQWAFLLLYDRWKAQEIQQKINKSIYLQAMETDYKYFDSPSFYNSFTFAVGELASKSESALQLLCDILGSASTITAMTAYLAALGPWVIVISVVGQGVCLAAQGMMQKMGFKKAELTLPYDRKLNYIHRIAYQKQYAADMKTTALPGKLMAMFDQNGAGKLEVIKSLAAPNFGFNLIQFAAWNLCRFAQLAYLIGWVVAQKLSVGTVSGMFAAASSLNSQLNRFIGISGRATEASLYAEKIRGFWEHKSQIEPISGGLHPPSGAFAVELKDVSFGYPGSGFRIHNLNISIAPGEKIAIVGENGAGKTTLAKLLLRLYDVDGGELCIGGRPVKDYDIHTLRRKIGVAFQEPQLYSFSVRDNMRLYSAADDSDLGKALEKARLSLGLDSNVTREFDEDGVILSGGQTQKLGLARLLCSDFGLLILDEPSSALDPLAEAEMTELIFNQAQTTTIMVAHRLSTVRGADRIYLIAGGEIAEQGTHDELMAYRGKYAKMFATQAEGYSGG